MCKLAVIPGINDNNRENVLKLLPYLAKSISSNIDVHGFGVAAMTKEGTLFAERWKVNDDAFKKREAITELDKELMESYKGVVVPKEETYSTHGEIKYEEVTCLTLHARFATSGREFKNTHPFIKNETSLIHNGVISNYNVRELELSTCDSEKILQDYIKHDVPNNPDNIQKVAKGLDGYFACAVLSKTSDGTPILDVFKCDSAQLYCAFVTEINSLVFVTRYEQLESACKELGFSIKTGYTFMSNRMLRLNALTGEIIKIVKFNRKKKGGSYGSYLNYGNSNHSVPVESNIKNLFVEKYKTASDYKRSDSPNWERLPNGAWKKV